MPVTARRMVEGWELRTPRQFDALCAPEPRLARARPATPPLPFGLAALSRRRSGRGEGRGEGSVLALGWEGLMGSGVLNDKAESGKQKPEIHGAACRRRKRSRVNFRRSDGTGRLAARSASVSGLSIFSRNMT